MHEVKASAHIASLLQTLHDLLAVHDVLLDLAERKRQALMQQTIDTLKKIVEEEMAILPLIRRLEAERMQQVSSLYALYSRRPEKHVDEPEKIETSFEAKTFSELLAIWPKEDASRSKIEALAQDLASKMVTLRWKNEMNQALIEFSLQSIDHYVKLFAELYPDATYLSDTTFKSSTPPTFFERKL